MKKVALAAFLLLAAPAAAQQQCQSLKAFAAGAAERGFEFIGQGKDDDGDVNFVLWHPERKVWMIVFVPQQNKEMVCLVTGGRDFEKTDPKAGTF